ncbi:ParA family protein [Nocardiopsis ganjiahuensis]|uniref:ParA family protein n=1 Tax=Nocardiopsis ganjiahuensis TaxID=239984 RepID=UPI00034B8875|nr:ParA family protein [Nocardiopsis ganjiahuensis]
MASPIPGDREKVTSKLPGQLRARVKVRAAEYRLDMQDVVFHALQAWQTAVPRATVDTSGAPPFSTWLPPGVYEDFKARCIDRGVSYIQGLAQALELWLADHPSPQEEHVATIHPRRRIMANQKGGVGKTSLTAGVGQAYAEGSEYGGPGQRVLLIDFDPQGHLTTQFGVDNLGLDSDSLVKHMTGEAKGDLADLVVPITDERFGDRLHLLPACADGFVLDVKLSTIRAREAALERALEPLESAFDVIVIDCPPSLGLAMDSAIYYGRRRPEEKTGASGVVIPVQAEDSSADAFTLLTGQIEDLRQDMRLEIDYLGLVVNMYDSRRGFIATSSLQAWEEIGDPAVIAVVPDRKEQREAVRSKQGLLVYDPKCAQAVAMRKIAGALS